MVKRPMAQEEPQPKALPIPTHYGPKFEVTLKLDPGQLAELVELVMPLRTAPSPIDPEAEAADLLAIQRERQRERARGARQERERIVTCIREAAKGWVNAEEGLNEPQVRIALLDLANAIQYDLGSSS